MPSQRIRAIKPEFWTLPSTEPLTFPARILRLAMHNWANDYGFGETNLTMLLGLAFPESDGVTMDELKGYLCEIAEHCETVFYAVNGRHYFCIRDWEEHQRVDTRNKQPYPTIDDPDAVLDQRFHRFPGESPGNPWELLGIPPSNRGTGEPGNWGSAERGNRGSADQRISGSGVVFRHLGKGGLGEGGA